MIRITIIYDNETTTEDLKADWGFACLVEAYGRRILFDTGAKGAVLMANMEQLQIDPASIEMVVISHDHWDHTGGLNDFLKIRPVKVYVPASLKQDFASDDIERVAEPIEISDGIHSTGELGGIEQSLVIMHGESTVVVVGCSHPGVPDILEAAGNVAPPKALIGGLHGFREYDCLESLDIVCPTHCTKHIAEIKEKYPDKYLAGGAGTVIEIGQPE